MSNRTLWKIKVDVHQVYNLRLPDSNELPDPYIAASLELPRAASNAFPVQRTASKSKTASGTFNSVMLFIANIYDFDFDKIKIVIRVHNGKKIVQVFESDGIMIGTTTFSLSKVYAQPKHWIPREWLPITSPTSPGDCRGYVQVSIGVFGPGDDVPSQLSDFQLSQDSVGGKDVVSRSILEKIVQTPETSFHNCMLIFNVLRAESLPVLAGAAGFTGSAQVVPSSGYVRVSFVGTRTSTRVVQSNANPAWNESIRIPVLCPSWDQYVVVEVFSRTKSDSTLAAAPSDLLLGSAIFDFDVLYRSGIQPTWFNLYSSRSARNSSFASLYGGEYSGRVQVSASVARSSDVNASMVPFDASSIVDPATEEIVLFVDIYELAFFDDAIEKSDIPPEIWIEAQFGPNTFESDHILNSDMACVFDANLGRLEPIRIHLPVDKAMAYDLVLSVSGIGADGNRTRVCYARLPLDRFMVHSSSGSTTATVSTEPEWIKLSTITSVASGNVASMWETLTGGAPGEQEDDSIVAVANVLINMTAFKLTKGQFPDRPERIPYKMSTYELRFSAHQACNLPIADPQSGSLSSTFCRVTLAGVSAKTGVIPSTLYPVWNEGLRIEVDLPENPTLRPDVVIEVLERTSGVVLGFATMKTAALRPQWTGSPVWIRLQNPNTNSLGVEQESFVLYSAVLVNLAEAGKFPIPTPLPQRGTFTVDLLIVGVRLLRNYSIENLNKIEICWGRQRDNPRKKVVTIRTNEPVAGEGGQFNFLQPALLDLDLPIDSTFQEFLEVRLLEQVVDDGGDGMDRPDWWRSMVDSASPSGSGPRLTSGSSGVATGVVTDRPIGYGFIHLNPHYAWVSDAERVQYRELFRMKTHEELRKKEEQRAAELAKNLDRKEEGYYRSETVKQRRNRKNRGMGRRKAHKDELELQYMESEIDAYYGIDMEENFIELPVHCFNSAETDALFPDRFRRGESSKPKPKGRRLSFRRLASAAVEDASPAARGKLAVANFPPQSKFMAEFVWEPTISKVHGENLRRELDGELEAELDTGELPFISVPLVMGSVAGTESFIVVGYLKVRCKVREKSTDSTEVLALQSNFIDQFDACSRIMCRLYVLRAEGIVPSGGEAATQATASYFLWIRNVCGDLIAEYPNCSIKDDGSAGDAGGGTNPEFNKCFQLPCSFPENSVLHIELYERHTGGLAAVGAAPVDTLIGSAMIDIENRWFHPKYQTLTDVPVEVWTLRSGDAASIPKGKLRLWLELMDQVTSMGRPIEALPSPQPETLQVRAVLWRTRGVPNTEGEEQSHQGLSVFMQNLDPLQSDTHYGSLDGTGTFNYRFVLNPTVPTEDGTVRFQLQHRPLVGLSNVAIGEVTLDLSNELASVRRTRRAIDLPRCWVPLTHPAFIGKFRGFIEIQIRVLTSEEARSFPVGQGRDAPNSDPYLDGDDPHLVQHRNALANTVVGRSLGKYVEAMKKGIRLATILFIIGSIIAGIVSLVLLLISMGVIKLR